MRLFLIVAVIATVFPLEAKNSLSRREKRDGWQLLFDGHSLGGFHTVGPGKGWIVKDGHLTWRSGGAWLATDDAYFDFVLRLEYRTGKDSNSGVFVRSLPAGDPAATGFEFDIGSGSAGAVPGLAPAKNAARKAGEWNKVEITVQGRRVSAVWNGDRVIDAHLDDVVQLSARSPFGHVGLESSSTGAPVEFRNLRIRVLKIGPRFPPKDNDDPL